MSRLKSINWISCKDKEPEDGEIVLAYGDCGFHICKVVNYSWEKGCRFYGTAFTVTHWAKLVAPKKEKITSC
jgi:hypothetical protein